MCATDLPDCSLLKKEVVVAWCFLSLSLFRSRVKINILREFKFLVLPKIHIVVYFNQGKQ